jgi:hypothetical protein
MAKAQTQAIAGAREPHRCRRLREFGASKPGKIGEKFIDSYLGAGTLSSAARSADAKVMMARVKRRTPWAAVFCCG